MAKQLTPEQRKFVETFVVGAGNGERKKIEIAYVDFDRRRAKVAGWLDKVGAAEDKALLRICVQSAISRAETGDFRGAYDELDEVKRQARGLAQGSLTALPLDVVLQSAERQVAKIGNLTSAANAGMGALVAGIMPHEKPESCTTYDELKAFRAELTEEEARWRGTLNQFQGWVDRAAAAASKPDLNKTMTLIDTRLKAMQTSASLADRKSAGELASRFAALQVSTQKLGKLTSSDAILADFRTEREGFEGVVANLKNCDKALPFVDAQREAFAEFEAAERDRLERAMVRVAGAAGRDAVALNPDAIAREAPSPHTVSVFRLEDLYADGAGAPADQMALDGGAVQAMCDKLAKFMADQPPGSDRMLDLTLKSAGAFAADLAGLVGLPKDPEQWGEQAAALKQAAGALRQTMLANNPNRCSDKSIVLNGVKYEREKPVGQGGMGIVWRYIDPVDGKAVIVKTVRPTGQAGLEEVLANEARVQWQLSGGDSGQRDPNVVKMEAVALDENGRLNLVMEEAKGGDLDSFASTLNECERLGILPAAARNALTQNLVLQAARGLKSVHRQDELHLDIKGENFLVALDGTVMISDFGTVQSMAGEQGVDGPISTTPRYAPTEYRHDGGHYTASSDVFSLGSMVHALGSDIGTRGEDSRTKDRVASYAGLRTTDPNTNQIVTATAFDRLRNAMLDPDPAKRPTLDGVIASAYLDIGDHEDDVKALAAAVARYNQAIGKRIQWSTKAANERIGALRGKKPVPGATAEREVELRADLRKEIEKINQEPEIKVLVEAIRQASAVFAR